MRESRTSGSVRGDRGNPVPYRYTTGAHGYTQIRIQHQCRKITGACTAPLN